MQEILKLQSSFGENLKDDHEPIEFTIVPVTIKSNKADPYAKKVS